MTGELLHDSNPRPRKRGRPSKKGTNSSSKGVGSIEAQLEQRTSPGTKPQEALASNDEARGQELTTLRSIPTAPIHFWKKTWAEQLQQTVTDRNSRAVKRSLPKNEIQTLAFNEAAVRFEEGFFLHLPSRDAGKAAAHESLIPQGRVAPAAGARYPSMVYMRYPWDERSLANFYSSTHRARYLLSNALLNLPPRDAPLYAIQYATFSNFPIYRTEPPSLVIFATPSACYLCTTQELEDIVGRKQRCGGPDPGQRIEMPRHLFDKEQSDMRRIEAFGKMAIASHEDLYNAIRRRCGRQGDIYATFTAGELMDNVVPRPASPASAQSMIPLGIPFRGEDFPSAWPPTRRDEHRRSKKKRMNGLDTVAEYDGGDEANL